MKTASKCFILLALTVSLGMVFARPASAQLPPQLQALRQPVPENELQRFSSDMTSLMRVLYSVNASHPEVQSSMAKAGRDFANLTPEELTVMANAYDRTAVSAAVQRLTPLIPQSDVTVSPAVAEGASANTTPPVASYPIDPTTTSIVAANYGTCGPNGGVTFLGGAIPSNNQIDYNLYASVQAFTTAQVVLNYFCYTMVVIFGEGTNAWECVPAGIADAVVIALQLSLQTREFCDIFVTAAENDATYSNTFAVFNNLASTRSDIDESFAALGTQVSSVNSNLTNEGLVLSSNVLQAQADLDTRVNKVDADVTAGTTQVDNNISTLQALQLRMEIERSLALGTSVGLFETPQSQGGYLEVVGSTVQTVINGLQAAGQNVGQAQQFLNFGKAQYAAGKYKAAYHSYAMAYQTAVQ